MLARGNLGLTTAGATFGATPVAVWSGCFGLRFLHGSGVPGDGGAMGAVFVPSHNLAGSVRGGRFGEFSRSFYPFEWAIVEIQRQW